MCYHHRLRPVIFSPKPVVNCLTFLYNFYNVIDVKSWMLLMRRTLNCNCQPAVLQFFFCVSSYAAVYGELGRYPIIIFKICQNYTIYGLIIEY